MNRRTALDLSFSPYGKAISGAVLTFLPARKRCRLLLIAGMHGEEPDGIIALSRALRSIQKDEISPHLAAVLCANPDGITNGTRGNALGVDLNRNFPSSNWSAEMASCRWHVDDSERLPISSGKSPGSEPETRALMGLIESLQPTTIIALHGPLACIDAPEDCVLGMKIAERTQLPHVADIGYPTPGSLGSWCAENGYPLITWEFPDESIESISRSQVPTLVELISGKL